MADAPLVRCGCGQEFTARPEQAGGIVNCPRCARAVEVPGLRDPFWRMIQAVGVVVWIAVIAAVYAWQGTAAALLAAIGGAFVLWLLSRAL
jgi:hypothetical protein